MTRTVRLTWPGRGLDRGAALRTQPLHHELHPLVHLPATARDRGTARLIRGDALHVAERLLQEGLAGRVDVVHLDPPFGSQVDYARVRDLQIRQEDGGVREVPLKLPAYDDTDGEDLAGYLDALEPVLRQCHRLLSPRGSLYVHLDFRRGPYVRVLLDEIFGADHLVNEIVWAYGLGGSSDARFQRKHDVLYFYARDVKNHWFQAPLQAATSHRMRGQPKRATDVWVTESAQDGVRIERDWPDALVEKTLSNRDPERTGYPTQKPLALAARLVQASLPPGGLGLDLMAGSGTFGVAAVLLGRDVILGDRGDIALDTARGRLVAAGAQVRCEGLTCEPGVVRIQADVQVQRGADRCQARMESLELPGDLDLPAFDRLSAWGLCTPQGAGLRALTWWDAGAPRIRPPVPRELTFAPTPEPLVWLGVDVRGQWYRCDL